MRSRDPHDQQRARQNRRLGRLRDRIALVSVLGFATLFGLTAHHSHGTSKRLATKLQRRTTASASSPTRFFDEQADGVAFADQAPPAQPSARPAAQPVQESPPAAQTSVS